MKNFLHFFRLHSLCLCSLLAIFSTTSLVRVHAFEPAELENICDNGKFDEKIYTLVMKLLEYGKKIDTEKMLAIMFKIKNTAENYIHKKINIDKAFDAIEEEIQERGAKIKKDDFDEIRKYIKKVLNRFQHKTKYMSDCSFYNIPYDSEIEKINYMTMYDYSDEDMHESELPAKVEGGIIIALAGAFLFYIPCTRGFGKYVMATGIALALDGTYEHIQSMRDKKKEKRREDTRKKKEEHK